MKIEQLEQQADSIEELLSTQGITARIMGGTVTPHFVRFRLWPAPMARIEALTGALTTALYVASCQVSRWWLFGAQIEIPRSKVEDDNETTRNGM